MNAMTKGETTDSVPSCGQENDYRRAQGQSERDIDAVSGSADDQGLFAQFTPVAWRWRSIFNEDSWCVSIEEPIITNDQYIVEPLYAAPQPRDDADDMDDFRWLIEAPGQRYLAPRHVGGYDFHWTQDHNEALAFRDESQADGTMMAIRQLAPALFDFERTLGNAKAVEHGWLANR